MSAPHPRFPDEEPNLQAILRAYGKFRERLTEPEAINGHPRDLDIGTDGPMSIEPGVIQKYAIDPKEREATSADRLDQIAAILLQLTWGEMVQLAAELWACRGDGFEAEGLEKALHRWAATR